MSSAVEGFEVCKAMQAALPTDADSGVVCRASVILAAHAAIQAGIKLDEFVLWCATCWQSAYEQRERS
jgi:hypothetical protein